MLTTRLEDEGPWPVLRTGMFDTVDQIVPDSTNCPWHQRAPSSAGGCVENKLLATGG